MKKKSLGIYALIIIAAVVAVRLASDTKTTAQSNDTVDPSETSIAIDLSIEQMVNQSDLIAIGNCRETRSVWIDRNLVTLATIAVGETLKGDATSQLTVVLPGGADANRRIPVAMTYPGAPRITPGEDVFLFLTRDDEFGGGSYTIAGFSQGKFSIVKDEEGREIISRDLTNVKLQGKAGLRRGTATVTPLETLKSRVRNQLQKN
ncbi:MAG TPA: hypothetical protein VIB00_06975 [Pyrinomonadaceae bacterium]|jgi:hypothetical protein